MMSMMKGQEFRSCTMTWRIAAMQARNGDPLPRWELFEKQHTEVEPSSLNLNNSNSNGQDNRPKVWQVEDEDFWRENLEPIEYRALRQGDWDSRASALYTRFFPDTGYFACRACGLPLFSAESKYDADSASAATPTFGCCVEQHVRAVSVQDAQQLSVSSQRKADTQCARCRSHVGNVKVDYNPTRIDPKLYFREKHAVNGLAVSYVKEDLSTDLYSRSTVLKHPPVILNQDNKPMPLFE